MVHYIFSDKTGTLTQNIMEFKKFSAGERSYGVSNPIENILDEGVSNVNFEDPNFEEHWTKNYKAHGQPLYQELAQFMNILAICHTIIPEKKSGVLQYNASSPDELALTNAARHFGIVFKDRDD